MTLTEGNSVSETMNTANALVERSQYTIEITVGDVTLPFVLNVLTVPIAATIRGSGSLMAIEAEGMTAEEATKELKKKTLGELIDEARPYLKACMVDPCIGDVSDPDNGVVTFEKVGDFILPVYVQIMNSARGNLGENATGFPERSEAQTD